MDKNPRVIELDKVSVAPDSRIHREIAIPVSTTVCIAPEKQWHGRHRVSYDQLTFSGGRLSGVVPGLNSHSQSRDLNMSRVNRFSNHATHEDGADVGSTTHGRQPHVPDIGVDPAVAVQRQWRAGYLEASQV